jgi:uncharacterized protein (TIGR03437 family)
MRTMIVIASVVLFAAASASAQPAPAQTSWKLYWSDEFNGPAGSPPDPKNWDYDMGAGGWGNGELENYTNSPLNSFQDGLGHLVIRAIRDAAGNYTSARLQTGSPGASSSTTNLSWQYGRIEARIKLPFGQGVWPAFWMLGEDIDTDPWPGSGEVDIMENFGTFNNNASINNGTAHGPGYSGANGLGAPIILPAGETVSNGFHVYSIDWSENSIQWYVDSVLYHTVTSASIPSGTQWVFNAPFFLLLNLAIGGPSTFLGTPDPNAPFPNQDMLVDYVRVYEATSTAGPALNAGGIVDAATDLPALSPGSLASIYGTGMATTGNSSTFDTSTDTFSNDVAGVQVFLNGEASPLIFLSSDQINFAIPWDSLVGPALNVEVMLNGILSNPIPITLGTAAPSLFGIPYNDSALGVANVAIDSCPNNEAPQAGAYCTLWGNGFGPTNPALTDGGLAPPPPLAWTDSTCALTIDGVTAQVTYCGGAPGEIIYQLNFVFPPGVGSGAQKGTLTINDNTGNFLIVGPGN